MTLDHAEAGRTRIVRGRVLLQDGTPLAGVRVLAADRRIDGDHPLGEATTDPAGAFEIAYGPDEPAERRTAPALVVRVLGVGEREPVATSETVFGAAPEASVDVEVPLDAAPAELDRVQAVLRPALGDRPLAELSDDAAALLAGSTSIPLEAVDALRLAARAAGDLDVPTALTFALARRGLAVDQESLLALGAGGIGRVLDDAVRDNVVPAGVAAQREEILAQVTTALAERLLRPGGADQPASLGEVLATVVADEPVRRGIARIAAERADRPDSIGDAVRADPELAGAAAEVEVALELAALSGRHLETIEALQRRGARDSAGLRRLAAYRQRDWEEVVDEAGVPVWADGATPQERRATRATVLARAFEGRYPTATLAGRVGDGSFAVPDAARPRLRRFFELNPAFELGERPVAAFLDAGDARLDGIDDLQALRGDLQRLERIVKLVPPPSGPDAGSRTAVASVLSAHGLDSAHRVARLARTELVGALAAELDGGQAEATAIHARAQQTAALALALVVQHAPRLQEPGLPVIGASPPPAAAPAGVPDLRTLFGSLDFCECDECRSVLSPAAYLVDVLHFLGDRALGGGRSVADVLLDPARRPDLAQIELSCENTNRRLPYVDLVNEILENAIAPRAVGTPIPQTAWTEQELLAAPEHVHGPAYDALRTVVYPWELPFDLWLEEIRAHLGAVGYTRHELMETLDPVNRRTSAAIAYEHLGLSRAAADLVLDTSGAAPWALFGLQEQVTNLRDPRDGSLVSGDWDAVLRGRVSLLSQQTGLSYAELRGVLDTRYVNSDSVSPLIEGDACDLTRMQVPWLDVAALRRLHRFTRLWRSLGWEVADVDRAVAAHGGEITEDTLVWLSHVEQLRTRLRLPAASILGWWSTLDTHIDAAVAEGSPASTYDRVFADPRRVNPPDSALALNQARSELADTSPSISAHRAAVGAGLGLSGQDLGRLLGGEVADQLTLANLSKLHAIVTLCRALRLGVPDYLRLRALGAAQPSFPSTGTPSQRSAATLDLVEDVDRIRASGFSLAELDYLLRDLRSTAAPVGPAVADVVATLTELRAGLRRIASELREAPDEHGEVLSRLLAQLAWPPRLIDTVAAVIASEVRAAVALGALPLGLSFPDDLPSGLQGKVVFDPDAHELSSLGALRTSERDALLQAPQTRSGPEYDAYRLAVEDLYTRSRSGMAERTDLVSRQLQSFVLPTFSAPLELSAPLAALPAGVGFPDDLPEELRTRVEFDAGAGELRVRGLLTAEQRDRLLELGQLDAPFQAAVRAVAVALEVPQELARQFWHDPSDGTVRFIGVMTTADRDVLRAFAAHSSHRAAIDALYARGQAYQETDPGNRFLSSADADALFPDARSVSERSARVQRAALPFLRRLASEQLVSATLGATVGLTPEATREVLSRRLVWPGRPGRFALEALLDEDFGASDTADLAAAFGAQVAACQRLQKLGLLMAKLSLQPGELVSLLGEEDWAWVNDLPVAATTSNPLRYAGWDRLVALVALRDRLPAGADVLAAVFAAADDAADAAAVRTVLADQLGFDGADLAYATAAQRIGMQAPGDYRDPRRLTQLVACFEALRLLGTSAQQVWAFGAATPGEADAVAIRRVVRGALGETAWLERGRALRDALRERQRSALVAHLVARERLRDADELFGRYLIDVQTDPCALTSRIRQATGSVQLFVQRCLLGLEADVRPSVITAEQWQWLKSYRVWEANRRVFLFPENWLDPELRDDKTGAFRALESALGQGELTRETAERAFAGYLEQLEQVARLEVVGAFREVTGDGEVLHVVARTFNTPHTHYYRRRDQAGGWSGWDRIDLDIQGDHIVPVVWNSRLFVFWAKLTQQANEPTTFPDPPTPQAPRRYWEVQLAWSERKADRWSPTQQLTEPLAATLPGVSVPAAVFIAPKPSPDALTLAVGYPSQGGTVVLWTWRYARLTGGQGRLMIDPRSGFNINGAVFVTNGRPAGTELSANALVEGLTTGQQPLQVGWGTFGSTGVDRSQPTQWTVLARHAGGEPDRFRLVFPLGSDSFVPLAPGELLSLVAQDGFFFEDRRRSYEARHVLWFDLAAYWLALLGGKQVKPEQFMRSQLAFVPHYHPWAAELAARLNEGGIRRLVSPDTQRLADAGSVQLPTGQTADLAAGATFWREYVPNPTAVLWQQPPREDIDFDARGAYAVYNWELFFHAPVLIATRLGRNQRFAEAQEWFHLVFDPTDDSTDPSPGRYWRTRPFRDTGQPARLEQLLETLASRDPASTARQEVLTQVEEWRRNPFRPHAVARWRTSAYQRAVVMAYVDNLIAWGDQLFRRDTPEAVNEAAQHYVLAASILGPPPERIPARSRPATQTYAALRPRLDELSNALVEMEAVLPPADGGSGGQAPPLPLSHTLYFCAPHNTQLLERWDRVADRLFKLRHCMNIEGVVRELPLFDRPIDPGLLVRAVAAGIDLGAALSDLDAPLSPYRFAALAQKASELCGHVVSLGSTLLAALERRDGEALALLRSSHELAVVEASHAVRRRQLEEARAQLDTLAKSLELAQGRLAYHLELLSAVDTISIPPPGGTSLADRLGRALVDAVSNLPQASQASAALTLAELVAPGVRGAVDLLQHTLSLPVEPSGPEERVTLPLSQFERRQLDELQTANAKQQLAMDYESLAQVLAFIPDITIGTQGISSPVVQASIGGTLLSMAARLQASGLNAQASDLSSRANLHAILAGHQRRAGEWLHQSRQTLTEIEQIGKQLVAAGIQVAVASEELRAQQLQIGNAREADALVRGKFTNQELCDWLAAQISAVYLAGYQLAYDLAKRAERAYRYELGVPDSSFIRFGYWDSLRKGLLAGERLLQDLKRMEVSYLDLDQREHELTKHVSLAQVDPAALVRLKLTGACELELGEALFDLDRPGHYRRRIKAVSLSLPCVAGPYTPVHCTLTLLRSAERVSTSLNGGYARATDSSGALADDPRFTDAVAPVESIVTSTGQDQYGLFEPNLRDDRRLPFERRGAISRWRIELPASFRQFDYATIADVVLHLRYTAREGGRRLADAAVATLRDGLNELVRAADGSPGFARLFSLRHELGGWYRLVAPAGDRSMDIEIGDRFPILFRDATITIHAVDLFIRGRRSLRSALTQYRRATFDSSPLDQLAPWNGRDNVLSVRRDGMTWDPADGGRMLVFDQVASAATAEIEDVWLVCHYQVDIQ